MSSESAMIRVDQISKSYQIYAQPGDRLKQFVYPRLGRLVGNPGLKYYKDFWAINDVSFAVGRGETIGIIGRNGSGKSTLLQMICGTLSPTGGSIRVEGKVAALLELGSGFNPEFSGRENVFLNASLLGLQTEQIEARFDSIAAFADIGDHIEQPVKTYSSGMMVRLAFAVIAHVDADILVIDEALAVGDAFFTQKCMRFMRNFMKSGTVLFVSHDTASVRSLCNRAIWIEKGQIVEQGDPKEVCEHYLEAYYEAQQGKSTTTRMIKSRRSDGEADFRDQRAAFVNHSNLRNDLRIFEFDPSAASFGTGDALIRDVRLTDSEGNPLNWVVGGEAVRLQITMEAIRPVHAPIVGFFLKDHLGQTLFGDNTYLTYLDSDMQFDVNDLYQAEFSFQMPILPAGMYSIVASAAAGSQEHHVQHHWIHDALFIKSESSSHSTGLIGIPMSTISMLKLDDIES
jgi:lipopolysaccharide transport system ATP-binding protein